MKLTRRHARPGFMNYAGVKPHDAAVVIPPRIHGSSPIERQTPCAQLRSDVHLAGRNGSLSFAIFDIRNYAILVPSVDGGHH
jgi:hypothetical protein